MLARYLLVLGASAALVVGGVGALYAVADPQGLLGTPPIKGINVTKPYLEYHRELVRWVMAQRACPSAGVFGNSRAEIGFNPAHPALQPQGERAFNHAIPGSAVDLARDQLRWLREAQCPQRVAVIGLEFMDFLFDANKPVPPVPALRPRPRVTPQLVLPTMFSLTGLNHAWKTLRAQHVRSAPTVAASGWNPMGSYEGLVQREGHDALFRQRLDDMRRRLTRGDVRPLEPGTYDYAVLRDVLRDARQAGTKVILVSYPYHLQLRQLLAARGLEGALGDWKFEIAKIAEEEGAEFWDFAVVSRETTEPVPPPRDREPMAGYWEAGHFKRELGDGMLDQVFLGRDGFGVRLKSGNARMEVEWDQARLRATLRPGANGPTDWPSRLP